MLLRLALALGVSSLAGCGDYDMAMRSAALSLETLFSRILLKEAGVSWRYTAASIGGCSSVLTPKYCMPVGLTEFKKIGWGRYEATYSMRTTQAQCAAVQREIGAVRAQPQSVANLRGAEDLDSEHLERISKTPVGSHLAFARALDEMFNAQDSRRFVFERNLGLIHELNIDCSRGTISIVLA